MKTRSNSGYEFEQTILVLINFEPLNERAIAFLGSSINKITRTIIYIKLIAFRNRYLLWPIPVTQNEKHQLLVVIYNW